MSDLSTVGKRLEFARLRVGLRQIDVAQRLGMKTGVQISKWESDEHVPNAKTLDALAETYETTSRWLLNGIGKPPVAKAVARGTSAGDSTAASFQPSGRHAKRLAKAVAFEREMLRLGALDEDADYINARARSFLESVLSSGGTETDLDEDALDEEFEAYLESNLRQQVQKRIALRKKGKGR